MYKRIGGWEHDDIDYGKLNITNDVKEVPQEPKVLEVVGNRIYFYSEIYRDKILKLNRSIREKDIENLHSMQTKGLEKPDPIYLHIQSNGGSIFAGWSGMDNILTCNSKVITVVDGICASAATFLSVVGDERLIYKHSYMLIHQLSSRFWGKYMEFKDAKQNMDSLMKKIKMIYSKYTKIPVKKLNEILSHDLYFDAATCLKYSLVDKII